MVKMFLVNIRINLIRLQKCIYHINITNNNTINCIAAIVYPLESIMEGLGLGLGPAFLVEVKVVKWSV